MPILLLFRAIIDRHVFAQVGRNGAQIGPQLAQGTLFYFRQLSRIFPSAHLTKPNKQHIATNVYKINL